MHKRFAGLLTLLMVAALAPLAARAATISFTPVGGGVVDPGGVDTGAHWDPATALAASGDTIVWHFGTNENNHRVAAWATDGANFSTNDTPHGDYTQAFTGGTVWFRDPQYSSFDESGLCTGMCGGYTSIATAPGAPVISAPAAGATVNGRNITISGTAQPLTVVQVNDDANQTERVMAGRDGAWSVLVFLGPGAHTFEASSLDVLGRASPKSTVSFTVADGRAPDVTYTSGDPVVLSSLTGMIVEGTAKDDTELGEIFLRLTVGSGGGYGGGNSQLDVTCVPACRSKSIKWTADFSGVASGYYYATLIARDVYGNENQSVRFNVVKI